MSVKVIETISLKIRNKNVKSRLGGVSKEGPLLLIQYHSCRQSFFPLLDLQRGCVNAIRNVSPQLSHSDTENIESHRRNTQRCCCTLSQTLYNRPSRERKCIVIYLSINLLNAHDWDLSMKTNDIVAISRTESYVNNQGQGYVWSKGWG